MYKTVEDGRLRRSRRKDGDEEIKVRFSGEKVLTVRDFQMHRQPCRHVGETRMLYLDLDEQEETRSWKNEC